MRPQANEANKGRDPCPMPSLWLQACHAIYWTYCLETKNSNDPTRSEQLRSSTAATPGEQRSLRMRLAIGVPASVSLPVPVPVPLPARILSFPNTLCARVRLNAMPHAVREFRDPARLAGDETLVRQHLLRVWRYLRGQGARAHDADDLTQETFLVALRRDATRLEPAAAAAFLQHTARYLFLRRRRGDRASTELADAVDALWQ